MPEPRLEELSAYLDHELTGAARQEVESHLQACETCRRRLEALRQTVGAIQELPVEAAPRPFTIPAQREQPRRAGPILGWLGGAAAAALLAVVVIAGLQNQHGLGAASPALSLGGAAARSQNSGGGTAAPPAPDQAFGFNPGVQFAHRAAPVLDPANTARRLQLASDSAAYARGATIRVEVVLGGSPVATPDAARAGIQLSLTRNGAGTLLPAPAGLSSSSGPPTFVGSYPLAGLSLPTGPGSYDLVASWTVPDGSGTILTAQLPIQIQG